MVDQRVTEGEKIKFFDKEALTTTLPGQLALKYKLDIVPIFIERKNNSLFKAENLILTPHLGEAARLLNTSVEKVKKNRVSAAKRISNKYSSVVVLKSHETLICKEDKIYICDKGNPGMATAGMGDVLSGMISGLIAQKLSLFEAACLGVDLHARAGDIYSKKNDMNVYMPLVDGLHRVLFDGDEIWSVVRGLMEAPEGPDVEFADPSIWPSR